MLRKSKSKTIIVFIVILVILALILVFGIKKENKKVDIYESNEILNNDIDISKERVKSIINENIKDRSVLTFDNYILVGENTKQLENDFYDIKFGLEDIHLRDNRKLVIYINKMWKNFNDNLYEEAYINELVLVIEKIFNLEESADKLKEDIKEEYINSKSLDEYLEKEKLQIGYATFDFEIISKELVVTISY